MWAPMWVLRIYPVLWNYNLLTTEPPLEPSIYSFNALKFAWLFESFVPGHFMYYHPHFHLFQMKLWKYYVLTVWWGHLTFFRHFSGNSLVLVLADFSMNFRMHLSNSKISLVIFLWALLSTYSVSIYTVHYTMLFFFLSGNVFLCDVRDWTQCHTIAWQVFHSWTMSSCNLVCSQEHVHVSSDRPCMFLTWLLS